MRPISWLHISDFHLQEGQAWSQDVVLRDMCQQIEAQRAAGTNVDFVLVTGDIAFSGKASEYSLAERFFNRLEAASGVPLERIFCVPGNHDIDRTRQGFCFKGARTEIQNSNQMDTCLAGGEDLKTLQIREENYRRFQDTVFAQQDRNPTQDGLAYVSRITIGGIRLAIVGLDSAWLAEGGLDDQGKLFIGERQVINAIELAREGDDPPHIMLGMAHHPFHWLKEFDRRAVQNRLEGALHFYHCGHLHEPNTTITGSVGSGCLTVAAGAAFESRQYHNSYSMVKLDLASGVRIVDVFRYTRETNSFTISPADCGEYPIEVDSTATCDVGELGDAIRGHYSALANCAFYLAALLLDMKSEFLIPTTKAPTFGSFELLKKADDGELKRRAMEFMKVRNILRLLYGQLSLPEILDQCSTLVVPYGEILTTESNVNPALKERLQVLENDSKLLAGNEERQPFSNILHLLDELAQDGDWVLLREQAERHLEVPDLAVAYQVKRMLAFALAQSEESADKERAVTYYRYLIESDYIIEFDVRNLAVLLNDAGCTDDAMTMVLEGIRRFPLNAALFAEFGHEIVGATGDIELRKQLEYAMRGQA